MSASGSISNFSVDSFLEVFVLSSISSILFDSESSEGMLFRGDAGTKPFACWFSNRRKTSRDRIILGRATAIKILSRCWCWCRLGVGVGVGAASVLSLGIIGSLDKSTVLRCWFLCSLASIVGRRRGDDVACGRSGRPLCSPRQMEYPSRAR